jgi:hypothetical protein
MSTEPHFSVGYGNHRPGKINLLEGPSQSRNVPSGSANQSNPVAGVWNLSYPQATEADPGNTSGITNKVVRY